MSTKYTKEVLQDAASNSFSIAGVLRYLGLKQAGGTQSHIGRMLKKYEIDTSHFTGQGHLKGEHSSNRKTCEQILVILPEGSFRPKVAQLRRAMIECGVAHRCSEKYCPKPEPVWGGLPLVLEVDHVNGDWLDNGLENLRFLCPNCHSQQDTNKSWKSKCQY